MTPTTSKTVDTSTWWRAEDWTAICRLCGKQNHKQNHTCDLCGSALPEDQIDIEPEFAPFFS